MFHLTITRPEAEAITSSDKALNHYGTAALLLRIQTESRKYLETSIQ